MSRSGYTDDCDNLGLWRQAVDKAINGQRGQAFMVDLLSALDALPEKKLAAGSLFVGGTPCALGAVAQARKLEVGDHEDDHEDWGISRAEDMGSLFGISKALAAEIMYMNDEWFAKTDEQRFAFMRRWVMQQIEEAERREQARVERESAVTP